FAISCPRWLYRRFCEPELFVDSPEVGVRHRVAVWKRPEALERFVDVDAAAARLVLSDRSGGFGGLGSADLRGQLVVCEHVRSPFGSIPDIRYVGGQHI